MAWLMASFVCGITLSSAATMMMAISVTLKPRAHGGKRPWPGVSRNVILRRRQRHVVAPILLCDTTRFTGNHIRLRI